MNDMTPTTQGTPIERFSAGEISRRELGSLLGEPISFGDAFLMLADHRLPLPRRSASDRKGFGLLLAHLKSQDAQPNNG